MLILPIKKKWLDMIESGEKKEEYRDIKDYWRKRFSKVLGIEDLDEYLLKNKTTKPFKVILRNGYSKTSPFLIVKVFLSIDEGKEEWGAEKEKKYYVLKILEEKDEH